jgi:hypothetical protein
MSSRLEACRTIELPRIESVTGAITPVEGNSEVPFSLERVFFLYDVVAGAERGGHAHKLLEQVYRSVDLRQPHVGLYVPTMVWSELVDFASGTIAVVLASREYDESEYIRDYEEFMRLAVGDQG